MEIPEGWEKAGRSCPKCGSEEVIMITWDDDEGHEDEKYRCYSCSHTWWVEGSDY